MALLGCIFILIMLIAVLACLKVASDYDDRTEVLEDRNENLN